MSGEDHMPDPLKDYEATKPYVPDWIDRLLDVPPLAVAVIAVAVIATLMVLAK